MGRFFGEPFDAKECNKMCDVCASESEFEERDMTESARHIVQYLNAAERDGTGAKEKRVTLKQLVDTWRGKKKLVLCSDS
jgi:bloom syndrome protein